MLNLCFSVEGGVEKAEAKKQEGNSMQEEGFAFLGRITWKSTIGEVDQIMSDMGIKRHPAYSFWEGREFKAGKGNQYLPYATHNIFGGAGRLVTFKTGPNRAGIEEIGLEYIASSTGFRNVYSELCSEFGESYRLGMLKNDRTGKNMSAYIWETGDAYIILHVSDYDDDGTGSFMRAENGWCDFGIIIRQFGPPDYFVYSE